MRNNIPGAQEQETVREEREKKRARDYYDSTLCLLPGDGFYQALSTQMRKIHIRRCYQIHATVPEDHRGYFSDYHP